MKRSTRILPTFPVATAAVVLGTVSPAGWAEVEIPFAEAELFFELNNTDGDLGIHSSIDGEGWTRLMIEDPSERRILDISVKGRLGKQGLTQLFFESAEPPFDELAPEVFFQRFPEGVYEIEARTLEGVEMESEAGVSHAMPAPPSNIRINGALTSDDCESDSGPSVSAGSDTLITWDPVETTHPELGNPLGSPDIEIVVYQVFVDQEDEDFGLAVDQGPSETDFLVPSGLLAPGPVKLEIIAREATHNQTATETCFNVVE